MPDDFEIERFEWTLDEDADKTLRCGLAAGAPDLRAELWWWMSQRGKAQPSARPDVTGLDPGANAIVDRVRDRPEPEWRKADWALAMYTVLTLGDHPDEWLFASGEDGINPVVGDALRGIDLPDWWQETLIGAAVLAVGISKRIR